MSRTFPVLWHYLESDWIIKLQIIFLPVVSIYRILIRVFLPRLPSCCLLIHSYFLFTFPSKRQEQSSLRAALRWATVAEGLQREQVPHTWLLSFRKLYIVQVLVGKNVTECKRNRPLKNSFDFNGKEELSDEQESGEKSWLHLPSCLNPNNSTSRVSIPVFVDLGLKQKFF